MSGRGYQVEEEAVLDTDRTVTNSADTAWSRNYRLHIVRIGLRLLFSEVTGSTMIVFDVGVES